jgi:hypothetical protein
MKQSALKIKKWVAISGTWRLTNQKMEKDVRGAVKNILKDGGGIVTGGALNVDFFAMEEALNFDPTGKHIRVFLPTTLEIYAAHYRKRAQEGIITPKQAERLIFILESIKKANPKAIIGNKTNKIVDKTTYFERNMKVVEAADELLAFHVVESTGGGTLDTIEKAKSLGIPVKRFDY